MRDNTIHTKFSKNFVKFSFLFFLINFVAFAQKEATIFTNFKKDRSVLPEFSYAGYHHGEIATPNVNNYKVFDVTTFGAIPDDTISDKKAIQKAITAANKNGSGIVFFS